MSDLIRREDAIDAVHYYIESGYKCDIFQELKDLPSAEPERHRGEWIGDGHERGFSECSKCGYIAVSVLSERNYKFCPKCGADMRGE